MRQFCKPEVGIILTKENPIFRTGGKHPIRFIDTFINKVINENPDVRLIPSQNQRFLFHEEQMSIDSGNDSLCCGLFIPGGSIHLASQEKIRHHFRTQRIMKRLRIEVIIFHSISRLEENGVLQTFDCVHGLQLNFQRKGGRETLKIKLRRIFPLGLQEKLMRILIKGERSNPVFKIS